MKSDALYNLFRHAFLEVGSDLEGEELGLFDNHPVATYADTLVLDLLKLGKVEAAPEAALALNVWMFIVHQIYEIMRACKRNDDSSVADMEMALDIAAALWIGVDQAEGDSDSGNMLYNLAEQMGMHFGQADGGETTSNYQVVEAFKEFKLAIGAGECSSNPDTTYLKFRVRARKMFGYMTTPLVQALIHHIKQDATTETSDYIELYALSIGARVEACIPTAYSKMLDLFVRNNFQNSRQDQAIDLLQSIYDCLEINCSLIGNYKSGLVPTCDDNINPQLIKFAGYPLTFDATPVRK
jgi:hypothetical protein